MREPALWGNPILRQRQRREWWISIGKGLLAFDTRWDLQATGPEIRPQLLRQEWAWTIQ